jgi:hypothetical protein
MFFRTDRVNFSLIGPTSSRFYTRFSDAAEDVVDGRIFMGIHFRFADMGSRVQGNRVARWAYKYFLRSLDGDEFEFVRSLDAVDAHDEVNNLEADDDEDAEP